MVHQSGMPMTPARTKTSSTPQVNGSVAPLATKTSGRLGLNASCVEKGTPHDANPQERGRLGLPFAPAWKYYSAHVYPGIPAVRLSRTTGDAPSTPHRALPALRQTSQPPKAKPQPQQGWYTPAQNWEEIRNMPDTDEYSDTDDSSGSDVLFERVRQREGRVVQ